MTGGDEELSHPLLLKLPPPIDAPSELTACDSGVMMVVAVELEGPPSVADEEEKDDDAEPAEFASSSFTGLGRKAKPGEGKLVRASDRPREELAGGGEGKMPRPRPPLALLPLDRDE